MNSGMLYFNTELHRKSSAEWTHPFSPETRALQVHIPIKANSSSVL